MTEKEKILEELRKRMLTEMAIPRSQFRDYIMSKYPVVIKHLILCLTQPNHTAVNHWKSEIYGNFSSFDKLKYTKKYPTTQDFLDCGMETCFENIEDKMEYYIIKAYSEEDDVTYFNLQDIDLKINIDKLIVSITDYFNWLINNVNLETGVVDKYGVYTKIEDLMLSYNKC